MAYFGKRYHPPGTPPGTLTTEPTGTAARGSLQLSHYGKDGAVRRTLTRLAEWQPYLRQDGISWLHLQGAVDADSMRELGDLLQLHSLALEDVLNVGQRAKLEEFDDYLFVIVNLPIASPQGLLIEQISLFLGANFVVSICRGEHDPFEPVRQRLHNGGARMREHQADYLLYTLLDLVVDLCYPVLESFDDRIELLESEVLAHPRRETLQAIHLAKRELQVLRRILWPQREVLHALSRDEFQRVGERTQIYFRDCSDHIVQILEFVETYRDITASLLDVYLSSVSNRLNETMRSLTLLATVFMPLTFIVGLYGMNFDRTSPFNMPELGWRYGYLAIWGVMLVTAVLMIVFFRRRKWM